MKNPVPAYINGFRVEYQVTDKGDGIYIARLIPYGIPSNHRNPVEVFLHKTQGNWQSDTFNKELTATIGQVIDAENSLEHLKTPHAVPGAVPVSPGTPLILFHADEDEDDLQFFEAAIREIDPLAKVYSMPAGTTLCQLLTRIKPDMVFLGLSLKGKSSLECIAEIRSNPSYAALPVIVLSSNTQSSSIDTAYRTGADLFLSKPAAYAELLSSLRSVLVLKWAVPLK